MIELTIPSLPPSANRIWRRSGKRIHRSTEYMAWRETAGWQVIQQRQGGIKGPYHISLSIVRPDRRRRDLSNFLKATEDLLVSVGVVEDDSLAQSIHMEWATEGTGLKVRIQKAE